MKKATILSLCTLVTHFRLLDLSFQMLHAFYVLEKLLNDFLSRQANFDVVFWRGSHSSTRLACFQLLQHIVSAMPCKRVVTRSLNLRLHQGPWHELCYSCTFGN